MTKRKICVVITARPSYSRVKTLLTALKQNEKTELILVVSGSALLDRYGSAVNVIEKDGFQIAAKVYNILEGENLTAAAKTTGIGIVELTSVFQRLNPDIVVTIADRFETMATAISASYMNIPLAHIQGGEVTGNIDEKVRHSITKLADYHFVASEGARERVIKLGENPEMVFNTGCPSIDLAATVLKHPFFNFNPIQKYGGVGASLNLEKDYLVVLQHPVTTEPQASRKHILDTLQAIYEINIPTLWFWPNVDAGSDGTSKGIRSFREQYQPKNIHFFKNMEPDDFLKVLIHCRCLIGNSSVGIRECSYLGVPVVNIGDRQFRRDRGNNVIDTIYDKDEIKTAVFFWLNNEKPRKSKIYGGGNAGEKIASKLAEVPLIFHKTIEF